MFQTVTEIVKWASLPVLLIGSMFSHAAESYGFLLDWVTCLVAIIIVQRTVWVKEYFWAAGFVAIAVVFSPLMPVVKIFLLMGFTCIAAFVTLLAVWKTQPLPHA
ncbi:MAG: hypothetical protein WD696_00295 [Bryobacteraceae bacterium]